jgi:hypothetical protein
VRWQVGTEMLLTWGLTIPATMALAALISFSFRAGRLGWLFMAGQLDGVWIKKPCEIGTLARLCYRNVLNPACSGASLQGYLCFLKNVWRLKWIRMHNRNGYR